MKLQAIPAEQERNGADQAGHYATPQAIRIGWAAKEISCTRVLAPETGIIYVSPVIRVLLARKRVDFSSQAR
jgi:hypothetical protein